MNQRLERLEGLAPFLQHPFQELINLCDTKLHRTLMVVYGWRSIQEQLLIYQKGRTLNSDTGLWEVTDKSLIVTNAKPGTSAHNVITIKGDRAAMGADLVPLFPDGEADWNVSNSFWDALYELSWKVGLDPYGDLIGASLLTDKGHFEEPAWKLKLDGLGCLIPSI